ncbi:helix-turn-helix transcriptional regulator [Halomonas sp. BN3-1]|uniref:helix-turn-helix domain-containing protein n=1 Tax=Halomonas sp. BN3-1 TaxID=2082393 RepID=UPI000D36070B|nr:helix-turn-helix transcriptional regulator [Halomonas sp. BN3-1]
MSYGVEHLAARLKAAREAKGLSQRELSKLAGVPQSHISKIENHGVDLRVSSLSSIAHALELDLMLVPRKAIPAVQSIIRSVADTPPANGETLRELQRLRDKVDVLATQMPTGNYDTLKRRIREITQIHSQLDPDVVQQVRCTVESIKPAASQEAIDGAANAIASLRTQLARLAASQATSRAPRPAYHLEEEGDD